MWEGGGILNSRVRKVENTSGGHCPESAYNRLGIHRPAAEKMGTGVEED